MVAGEASRQPRCGVPLSNEGIFGPQRPLATCDRSGAFLEPVWNRRAPYNPRPCARQTRGEVYAFGPFRLDVRERCSLRGESPCALRAKLFDTLVELVRRAGPWSTREELIARVWPDAIVEEGNLSHNVSALRKALGDAEQASTSRRCRAGATASCIRSRARRRLPLRRAPKASSTVRGACSPTGPGKRRTPRFRARPERPGSPATTPRAWRRPPAGAARYGELVPLLEAALEPTGARTTRAARRASRCASRP
jgi:hypothetical protein